MLRHWEPWYDIQQLFIAYGAPKGELQIAQDLAEHGVCLGDDKSAVLMRANVSKIEALMKSKDKSYQQANLRSLLYDAKHLRDVLYSKHTVSLQTASALVSLYSLGAQPDRVDSMIAEVQHLLDDPETPLLHKKNFYEVLVVGSALNLSAPGGRKRMLGFLGKMREKQLKGGTAFFEHILYHLVEQGELLMALDVKENMTSIDGFGVEANAGHYRQLFYGCAKKGEVALFSKLQLEMRQKALNFSTPLIWKLFLLASANSGDTQHLLGTWENLKGMAFFTERGRKRFRHDQLKRRSMKRLRRSKHAHTQHTARILFSSLNQNGKMGAIGYPLWRKETLLIGGALSVPAKHQKRSGFGGGYDTKVVLSVLTGLNREGEYEKAAELYDVVFAKIASSSEQNSHETMYLELMSAKSGDDEQRRGRFYKPKFRITDPTFWYQSALSLSKMGRLSESLFCIGHTTRTDITKSFTDFTFFASEVYKLTDTNLREYYLVHAHSILAKAEISFSGAMQVFLVKTFLQDNRPNEALQAYSDILANNMRLSPEATMVLLESLQDGVNDTTKSLACTKMAQSLWKEKVHEGENFALVEKFYSIDKELLGVDERMVQCLLGFEGYKVETAMLEETVGLICVVDGTVAQQVEGFVEDIGMPCRVVVPQMVLAQLHNAVHNKAATEMEKRYFALALSTFRVLLDETPTSLLLKRHESSFGVNATQNIPTKLVTLIHSWAKRCGDDTKVVLLTNDTEMAQFATRHGVTVHILNRHAREMLGMQDVTVPLLPA